MHNNTIIRENNVENVGNVEKQYSNRKDYNVIPCKCKHIFHLIMTQKILMFIVTLKNQRYKCKSIQQNVLFKAHSLKLYLFNLWLHGLYKTDNGQLFVPLDVALAYESLSGAIY